MSAMSNLFWKAMARLVFLWLPATALVFVAMYFTETALNNHGLRHAAFLAGYLGLVLVLWMANFLLGPQLRQMKALRQARSSNLS